MIGNSIKIVIWKLGLFLISYHMVKIIVPCIHLLFNRNFRCRSILNLHLVFCDYCCLLLFFISKPCLYYLFVNNLCFLIYLFWAINELLSFVWRMDGVPSYFFINFPSDGNSRKNGVKELLQTRARSWYMMYFLSLLLFVGKL